jgi:hypothetical protein
MSTRLNLEAIIRNSDNDISNIRVYSHSRGSFTIYVSDSDGRITEKMRQNILKIDMPAHLQFEIKSFSEYINDRVPTININLPPDIVMAAIYGNQNKKGIETTIQKLFPHINLIDMKADLGNGVINFLFSKNISEIEKYLLLDYLNELTPVDFSCEIELLELQ